MRRTFVKGAMLALVAMSATALAQAPAGPPGGGAGGPPRGGGGGFGLVQMRVDSKAFADGAIVPAKHSMAGGNVQPDFTLSTVPANAQSIAIIMHDIEVSLNRGTDDVTHWLAWNIPATAPVTQIPEGKLPEGSVQGANMRRQNEYMGMGAPAGDRYHHYVFEFYALDSKLDLPPTASRQELVAAMNGKVVAKAAYVGRFKSEGQAAGPGGPPRGPGAGGPPGTSHPRFEAFYRGHLRKILAVRRGHRYACKANYHVTRFEYLQKLFPDARFIVPIRGPREHVASLMKQDRLFRAGESRFPRSLAQMRACGHFEFGLDRRLIQAGDAEAIASIEKLWHEGEKARAWGRYWAHLYTFLADRITRNDALQEAMEFVWFEDLCERPQETLRRIERHCDLRSDDRLRSTLAERLHAPTYYRPAFSPEEERAIEEETRDVVRRLRAGQAPDHRQAA